jgi:hypothetical protein
MYTSQKIKYTQHILYVQKYTNNKHLSNLKILYYKFDSFVFDFSQLIAFFPIEIHKNSRNSVNISDGCFVDCLRVCRFSFVDNILMFALLMFATFIFLQAWTLQFTYHWHLLHCSYE